jgi:two-component system OmpR family response regulator
MPSPMRLLVVEDDARLSGLLRRGLRAQGFAVDDAATVEDAHWMAMENDYDALVLDVGLPDGDGFGLCADLRTAGRWMPILMLTARITVDDRVRGLDVGADDYLLKPFAFAELSARVRALVRRGGHERPTVLRAGSLELDPARHGATLDGRTLELSAREFAVLELFARRVDDVLTRTEIIGHVWDWAYDGTSNIVDVYVRLLRQHLDGSPEAPRIETVRGVGYRLRVA